MNLLISRGGTGPEGSLAKLVLPLPPSRVRQESPKVSRGPLGFVPVLSLDEGFVCTPHCSTTADRLRLVNCPEVRARSGSRQKRSRLGSGNVLLCVNLGLITDDSLIIISWLLERLPIVEEGVPLALLICRCLTQ